MAGLAIASSLVGGTLRVRFSWVDAAVAVLIVLVASSASHATDRRPAINLSWEWVAFGVAYFLVRNLPRTRGESTVLAGAMVATAVAVSAYGMFQVGVEQEQLRRYYESHTVEALREAGITPGTPAQKLFEDRVLQSNEVYSTFGLANSLAGFLLGPLILLVAVGWDNLQHREGRGSRAWALALAAPLGALLLTCLLLTKSRSAYLGLAAALAVLAWRERRRVSAPRLAAGAIAGLVVVSALVAAGVKSGRLDRQVLTESTKSLGYRVEYWIGAWGVITDGPRTWLTGHGPGNFSGPYVRHKLARSSEEILDPHNLVLEVWAASGVVAALALVTALGLALRETLGPSRSPEEGPAPERRKGRRSPAAPEMGPEPESAATPKRLGWLVAFAGGGWLLASVVGTLDPFAGDLFFRWVILGAAWAGAVALGLPLWRRRPVAASGLGAAVLGVSINLLAAGGIGHPRGGAGTLDRGRAGAEPARGPRLRAAPRRGGPPPRVRPGARLGGADRHVRRHGPAVLGGPGGHGRGGARHDVPDARSRVAPRGRSRTPSGPIGSAPAPGSPWPRSSTPSGGLEAPGPTTCAGGPSRTPCSRPSARPATPRGRSIAAAPHGRASCSNSSAPASIRSTSSGSAPTSSTPPGPPRVSTRPTPPSTPSSPRPAPPSA